MIDHHAERDDYFEYMKRVALITSLGLIVSFCINSTSAADRGRDVNWPQWRGPLANGVAPHGDPPVEWSETRNVQWKVALPGRGASTPIIWEDQVFILTAIPTGKKVEVKPDAVPPGPNAHMVDPACEAQRFTVMALDRETGKVRWQQTAREKVPHEGYHRDHGYASGSPVTDGKHLVAYFGSNGLFCYDLTGRLLWQKDLGLQRTRYGYGEGTSPALHGHTVVILWDHEGEDFIVALDVRDGKELWRQKRDEPTGWSTPLIIEHEGRWQVVVNATNKARSYDLTTGELLWECGGLTVNAIPSPVAGLGLVFVMSGFRGNALYAIRPGARGDIAGTPAVVWSKRKHTPYVPSPLLYGNRLYVPFWNNPVLSILDAATGNPLVEAQRLEGIQGVYASPVGAADRVYLVGRDGNAVVLKKADKLEVLARNRLDDGFDASPAIAGKQMFLRGRQFLYCLSAK
ncbi:MAG: PQQ-binding-like beta-propeller repeat protein [Verrucomicrobia bacterium]|nr:PQQ-binding-like beta-propeller repeat protein [Verrucomicrobiota bacterium]